MNCLAKDRCAIQWQEPVLREDGRPGLKANMKDQTKHEQKKDNRGRETRQSCLTDWWGPPRK